MIIPIGEGEEQQMKRITKISDTEIKELGPYVVSVKVLFCEFNPL